MDESTNTSATQSIGDTNFDTFGNAITTIINTPFSVIIDEATHILNALHFVRADWFYAFIPLFIYLYLYSHKTLNNKNWHSVIDPKLLPFVLTKGSNKKRRRYPLVLTFIAVSLCITALAGPVYKKLPQPVYREQSSLVVLLDLSASMNATDIKPSRLSRAKLKLLDILKARKTGQTALIAYAADAFVVTPLTDDNATIANLVPALETEMMPAQGSNLSIALAKTFSLFNQAGIIKGDILIITDGIHKKDEPAIKKVSSQGHRLSILGIGTTAGGPIPLLDSPSGGFLLGKNGAIVIPKLQPEKLQRYALAGSGIYTELKAGDADVNRLTRLFQSNEIAVKNKQEQVSETENNIQTDNLADNWADSWQEEGHWLLLPLLLLASFWARKGWITAILPFTLIFFTSVPQPAYADVVNEKTLANVGDITSTTITGNTSQPLIDTRNLWLSPDQKAMKAFDTGDIKKAAEHFTDPDWKASAFYRNGNYQDAADTLKNTNSSDGFYNRANALAQLGHYPEAIKAYDRALELDPENGDAKYNLEQVKQALQRQQENSDQNSDEQSQDKQDQDSQSQEQQDQKNEDQSNSQESDSQESDSQKSDSQNKDSGEQNDKQQENDNPEKDQPESDQPENDQQQASDDDQKQAEEQELKQRDAEAEQKKQQEEKQQYDQQQKDQQKQDEQQQSDSVENKDSENDEAEQNPLEIEINPIEASISEEEKATEQWLKRIPDDPGGLLRRKFLYQYKRAPKQTDSDQPW